MFVNHGGKMYGDVNCALCTVAAIIGTTSDQIASLLGFKGIENEQAFAAGYLKARGTDLKTVRLEPHEWQNYSLASMKSFVKQVMNYKKAECYVSQGGSWDTLVPMSTQVGLMRMFPIGTQYAVYGSMSMKGLGAHWNYAIRTADGVEFRDYQYNDSEDNPPRISDAFIPPRGNSAESSGSYTQGIVLVFRTIRDLR